MSHVGRMFDHSFPACTFFLIYIILFTTVLSQWDFSHGKFGLLSPGGQCHATQPTVHAGCFSVSIAHRALTRTTGSLTCEQILMHATAHGSVRTPYALKVDSGRKIPCRIGEPSLRQRCAGPTLYQLSYIPIPLSERNTSHPSQPNIQFTVDVARHFMFQRGLEKMKINEPGKQTSEKYHFWQ